ncbi:MAG: biotin/lipoyl-binding protein [Acidipropionibacterium acidipropionici]|uniref:efflux RND transporter periplasmic adaptor subunit n=1 Tax=Acidipropionibacterium acidipropionici TaxID=1748 RepID=UPI002F35FB26
MAAADVSGGSFSHLWPRRHRWQITMLIAVAVVIALAVWFILGRANRSEGPGGTQYRTSTVSAQTLKSTVSASGALAPLQQESLSFDSSGTVTSVKVSVGSTVTKGQALASIDPSSLKVALQTAQADLAAAEDSLDSVEDDSSSTSTEISAAKAAVTVKDNAVTEAKSNLAGATLTAPFAGVVAAVGISKGDTSGSSANSGGGSAGGSDSSSGSGSTSTGTTSSSDSSSGTITLISKGTFTVTTSGVEAAVTGTVSSVGVVASTSDSDSGSSTFPVTVKVAGTHTDLLPGASVTVAITTRQLSGVIAVATDAISTENGSTYVQRLVDGKSVRTKITIGSVIGQQTVVKSGLKSGDQVIVATFKAAQGSGNASGSSSSGGGGMGGNGGSGGGMNGNGGSGGGGMPGGGGQRGGR